MRYLAFMYDDYYCWGIQQNFIGAWHEEEGILNFVIGATYENQNLEILDTETLGFKRYVWKPIFKEKRESYLRHYKDIPDDVQSFIKKVEKFNIKFDAIDKYTLTEEYPGNGNEPLIFTKFTLNYDNLDYRFPEEARQAKIYDRHEKMGYWELQ